MALSYENAGHILSVANALYGIGELFLMILLLAGSAFFSGSETAFFNLSRRQINLLQQSGHKLHNLTATLLNKPSQLLSCFLLGNMIVNVLFFAIASVLAVRVEQQIGPAAAAATVCLTFICLVLFGEILPKSLAYLNSRSLSVIASLPAFLCMKMFNPVIFIFRFSIVEPFLRLLLGPVRFPKSITSGEFQLLIEQTRKHGLITADENRVLSEIVEFGLLKVRHVMRPRVDMVCCLVTASSQTACKMMQKNQLTKLPVYSGTIDNITGLVSLRKLLLEAQMPLENLIEKVNFVPEQKTVESLLEFFRKSQSDTAIVVDEYGGIAGSVCLEDVAGELLGPIETEEIEPIEQTGPFEYRLAGNLAIHDLAQSFGITTAESRISTIAGLVTALLGKIPKSGDVAHLKNLRFTVEKMQKHRIKTIILTLEPIPSDDK